MFRYFPVTISQDGRKIPLISNWSEKATDDRSQLEMWRELFKDRLHHWGIPTGQSTGLLALDVDVKGDNGFETIKTNNLPVPNTTLYQSTPSGGAHYLFKYPLDGRHYGNRVKFLPGLDVRGEGGYIVYYGDVKGAGIAEPPQWLVDNSVKQPVQVQGEPFRIDPSIAEGIIVKSLETIREAPQGEANNTLNLESFKLGQLVASASIKREFAEQVLLSAARDRGKGTSEARATIKSGLDAGIQQPLTWCPFENSEPVPSFLIPGMQTDERWTPRRFTRKDLLNTSKLKKPQLFKGWSTEDIHITTADGGTGKTTLKLYEAVCLALGERFLGFECKAPGAKTLFITGEDTTEKLGAMIGQILNQMGLLEPGHEGKVERVLDCIHVKKESDMCVIHKDKQGFLYPNQAAFEKVMQAVIDIKPKMIVFDPIANFWGSEAALNDMAKAVNKFMGLLVERADACVEMINHMGKVSSNAKDMSQFAGRGGTGLPSNARVSKVLRPVFDEEFIELMGRQLDDNESAMMCNVNKFSDGSPLYNKPFLIIRKGFLFSRVAIKPEAEREEVESVDDGEKIFNFIYDSRKEGKYPTKPVIVAYFMNQDRISKARVERALNMLVYQGHKSFNVKVTENPDLMIKDKAYIVTDKKGNEVS